MKEDILKMKHCTGEEEKELCKILGADEFEFSLIQRIDYIDDKIEFINSFPKSANNEFSKKLMKQKELILSIREDYIKYRKNK